MNISSLLCFSLLCVFLEARPDESSHTSEIESQSVENGTPTAEEINERRSDNVESKNAETTALPTLQPVLKSENDDYESDNASNSDIAETRNQSNDEYDSEEQTIINSSKNMETTEIDKQEDRSGKSKKHTNKNKAKPVVDDDSSESTSDRSEQSVDSSEEESSELDLATPQNTRRMNSYPDVKAGQNLESRTAFGLKPRFPLLPIPIPTIIPTAGLPNPHTFTTPIPYLNPIKLQNYPNAPTYLKRLPFGSYNRNTLSGMPIFKNPDFPRPGMPLIDDFAAESYGNAYPFISSTPPPLDIFPQDIFPKNLYSKLMQASEHPIPYQPGLFRPFRNTGYQNPNLFLGQKDLNLRPHTLKRNL